MIDLSLLSLIWFSLTCSASGTAFYGIFLRDWKYVSFSFLELIWNSLIYALCISIVSGSLILVIKAFAMLLGLLLRTFGESGKIEFVMGKDDKFLKLIIENKEDSRFSGEFKIMKINDEKLPMPLSMGVVRGENIDSQVIIPKGEPIEIGLGLLGEEGKGYFPDVHNRRIPLNPQTKIYTKLSGNLEDGTEIIKEDMWFINYRNSDDGKRLGFGNLIEIKNFIRKNKRNFFKGNET